MPRPLTRERVWAFPPSPEAYSQGSVQRTHATARRPVPWKGLLGPAGLPVNGRDHVLEIGIQCFVFPGRLKQHVDVLGARFNVPHDLFHGGVRRPDEGTVIEALSTVQGKKPPAFETRVGIVHRQREQDVG